jgi:hypothetical protein
MLFHVFALSNGFRFAMPTARSRTRFGLAALCWAFVATQYYFANAQSPAPSTAATTTSAPTTSGSSTANSSAGATQAGNTLVLVLGAGGQDEFAQQFSKWSAQWIQLADQQNWRKFVIGLDKNQSSGESQEGVNEKPATDQSDLKTLESTLQTLASENATQGQRLWLVMIGHGTAAGKTAKFNLFGPDVSTAQLKSWLDKFNGDAIVVDCTSSSAPFLVELSSKNRIVVSATRSGSEINYARFGGYLAQALQDKSADLDHDHEVSLLEAFLKASKDTEKFYRENSRIATEHALLEDNADKAGTGANFYVGAVASASAAGGKPVDGKRSARIILWSSPESLKLNADQAAKREQLEVEIDRLRERKKAIPESDYYAQLENIMLEMNAIYDAAEAKPQP